MTLVRTIQPCPKMMITHGLCAVRVLLGPFPPPHRPGQLFILSDGKVKQFECIIYVLMYFVYVVRLSNEPPDFPTLHRVHHLQTVGAPR